MTSDGQKLVDATKTGIRQMADEFKTLLTDVANELNDAADDIENTSVSSEDLVARLRGRHAALKKDLDELDVEPLLAGIEAELVDLVRVYWRRGFAASLKAFAHWHDGVQQVGTTGTALKQALEDLANGKFETEFQMDLPKD